MRESYGGWMSGKLRVYEVARDLEMENKDLLTMLQGLGFPEVKNHMSVVPPEAIDRAKRALQKKAEPKQVEERIRPTVVKRRAAPKPAGEGAGEVSAVEASPATGAPSLGGMSSPGTRSAPLPAARPAATPSSMPGARPAAIPAARPAATPAARPAEPAVATAPVASAAVGPVEAPPAETVVAKAELVTEVVSAPVAEVQMDKPAARTPDVVEVSQAPAVAPEPSFAELAQTITSAPAVSDEQVDPAAAPAASPGASPAVFRPGAAPAAAPSTGPTVLRPGAQPSATRVATTDPEKRQSVPPPAGARPSTPPRTGIEVWEGRPGVPMQPPRGPVARRVQYDAKAGAGVGGARRPGQPAPRNVRGTRGRPGMGGPMGNNRFGSMAPRTPSAVTTQERGAHKRVVRIEGSIGLQTLAGRMGIKAHELLRKLIMLGMTGVNINSTLDADTAKIVASEFAWDVEDVAVSEEQALVMAAGGIVEEEDLGGKEPRPPVVTVMGHVDHGKTSLLDRIRKSNVATGEAGGITQHIGAYSVETSRGRITFLDTPGHAAFTSMRARGAQTTDIVILVVAADDGVMPQTREAAQHAKAAGVPIVVAINKCDKPDAQPERARRELSELALIPEEWGGETLFAEVSAHTGDGIDLLLEKVLLQAEMLNLQANPNKPAVGVVLEAQLDRGRGPVATVLITEGTLKPGDVLLAGGSFGKVRAMQDSSGRSVALAGPATPVEVIGLNDVPAAGDPVHVLKDVKKAQEIADTRKHKERRSLMPSTGPRLTLEDLYKAMKDTEQLELKVIVKADVHGSVEAVSDSLMRLSTDKVKVTVVHSAAGAITEGDVNLAVAAGAIIIGFNVRPAGKAASLAQQEKVEIRPYSIIYNVLDDVKAAMEGLLAPSLIEKVLGRAEVRQVFRISKAGTVGGCMVISGHIKRTASARLIRAEAVLWSGKLTSLKRFKEDVKEVKEGFDCGISLEGQQDLHDGDIIECFDVEEVRQTL